jgi:hypothetical protein
MAMNWWMLAAGGMAAICTLGHAVAGRTMFYRPISASITGAVHAGLFTAIWHLVTINFTLSAIALWAMAAGAGDHAPAWLIAAQFAGYAVVYFAISIRLGGALKLFQWIPFMTTAVLSGLAAWSGN